MPSDADEDASDRSRWTGWAGVGWCTFYGSGIIGTLVLYGLLQERVMAQPYSGGEYFKWSLFLVLCNRIAAIAFCVCMILSNGEQWRMVAPMWKYFVVSGSIVIASSCQYEALKYVSFPVQMLGKSFKMMPVMLWGMVISQKRYSLVDWLVAAAVTEGVVQFLMFGPIDARHNKGNSMYGLGLLVVFLFFDGFTSTQEEKLFRDNGTSKFNQMLYVNLGSAIISLGGLIFSGHLPLALGFVDRHPSLMLDAGLLSFSAVGAQFFIFSMVKEFGALVFAATMNVRQVFSVLLSYVSYGHRITVPQTAGLIQIFGALFYKTYRSIADQRDEAKPLLKSQEAAAGGNSRQAAGAPDSGGLQGLLALLLLGSLLRLTEAGLQVLRQLLLRPGHVLEAVVRVPRKVIVPVGVLAEDRLVLQQLARGIPATVAGDVLEELGRCLQPGGDLAEIPERGGLARQQFREAQPPPARLTVSAPMAYTRSLVVLASVALASASLLRNADGDKACVAEDLKQRAQLQNKLAGICEDMCKEVQAYPKCSCPDFVEPDSTPGVMTWDELLSYMDQLAQWGRDSIKGWHKQASQLQVRDDPPELPEQGYHGEGVAYKNHTAYPSDWGNEYGPNGPGAEHSKDAEEGEEHDEQEEGGVRAQQKNKKEAAAPAAQTHGRLVTPCAFSLPALPPTPFGGRRHFTSDSRRRGGRI